MRDHRYFEKLEEAFAYCFRDEPQPMTADEGRAFGCSCLQAEKDATWRLHNPPQKDLFHRG